MVVASHLANFSALNVRLKNWIAPGMGALGVDIFFVISGYVICSALMREFIAQGRISIRAFYYRRAFRILPPLVFYLAVVAALGARHIIQISTRDVAMAALFLCNMPGMSVGWDVAHTWSLAYEEQFYIIAPLALAIVTPHKKHLLAVALCGMVTLIFILYALHETAVAGFIKNFEFLFSGVVMALYSRQLEGLLKRISPLVAYIGIVSIFAIYWFPVSALHTTAEILVVCPLIGGVLLFTGRVPCALGRFLSCRPMTEIGRASYGIYLWQQLATAPYKGAGALFYSMSVIAVVVLSIASFRLLEKPLIRVGASLSERQIGRESVRCSGAHQFRARTNGGKSFGW
jgi:peptidoglycan/LPS O-acetylase OafA/YrhL